MSRYKQGKYTPVNPDKYVGNNINNIKYRSSWELSVNKFFDMNTRIIKWSSESICIPYLKPTDGKIHKYYPDYWVEYITTNGEIIQEIIEVKPANQTKIPRKNSRYILYEQIQYAINQSKWAAAIEWCKSKNIKFRIITENSIFN